MKRTVTLPNELPPKPPPGVLAAGHSRNTERGYPGLGRIRNTSAMTCAVLILTVCLHGSVSGQMGAVVDPCSTAVVDCQRGSDEEIKRAVKICEKTIRRHRSYLRAVHFMYSILGELHQEWGLYQDALGYYEKAAQSSRALQASKGDPWVTVGHGKFAESIDMETLGDLFMAWGQYAKAVEHYQKAINLGSDYDRLAGSDTLPQEQNPVMARMGSVYARLGAYRKALECYNRGIDYYGKSCSIPVRILLDRGSLHADLGQYDAALRDFKRVLALEKERTRYHPAADRAIALLRPKERMAFLSLDRGDPAAAERLVKEMQAAVSRLARTPPWWPALRGLLALRVGAPHEARDNYRRLVESAKRNHDAEDLFAGYTGMGIACETIGDDSVALDYYGKAVRHSERLRESLEPSHRDRFFEGRSYGLPRTAPYEGLSRVLMRLGRPLEALKQSEYTKARVFSEAMHGRRGETLQEIPGHVLKKDSVLTEKISAIRRKMQQAIERGSPAEIAHIRSRVEELEHQRDTHVTMLRHQYPLFAATKYPDPLALKDTALGASEWILAYDVTGTGVIIYLTRGRELVKALFQHIPRTEVARLVRTFRDPMEVKPGESLEDKLKSFDFQAGKKLADLLIAPLLGDLPEGTPLIVVPDDSLGVLPFEMLVLNEGGKVNAEKQIPYVTHATFFGDRNTISYYQSITALTLARTFGKRKVTGKKLLVVADPVFKMQDRRAQKKRKVIKLAGVQADTYRSLMAAVEDGEVGSLRFNRLRLTAELAEGLRKAYRGNATVYTGLDANKKDFLNRIAPELTRYDKVVFATHGYFGKDLPGITEPVLVLSLVPPGTDGYLRMSEVLGLKTAADVVALTACQTGSGQRIAGEGTMGMGRAFQYAGARAVLMSLWSVAEVSSVKLVESFFKYLKEGKTKLEALRLARREIRDSGYDHPFFWAPFILVGEVD